MADTLEKNDVDVNSNGNGANGSAPKDKPSDKPSGKQRVKFENSQFVIHPDVAALGIPTQTSEEYETLRDDIKKNGIRDAVRMSREPVTNNEHVVDGNHRIHIAEDFEWITMKDGKLVILNKDRAPRIEWVDWDNAVSVAVSASLRRNLTDVQKAQMAMRLLEVEKIMAKRRQAASARVSNVMKGVDKPQIIEVDYERLTKKGDIGATFSQDTVIQTSKSKNSRIKGTFEYEGRLMAAVDGMPGSRLVCYGLETIGNFKANGGTLSNYVSRSEEWQQGKNQGSYDGILCDVPQGDGTTYRPMVLVGPPVIFSPNEESIPKPSDTKGTKKAKGDANAKSDEDQTKGRASEKVAQQVGMSARSIEMLETVKNEDPEAFKRINEGLPIPGTSNTPETINSAYNRVIAARKTAQAADDKAEGNRLPDPDDVTPQEFLENHPLYGELKDNAEFVAAVSEWPYFNKAISLVKSNIGRSKQGQRKGKDAFFIACRNFGNIKHPYEWTSDGKGGFKVN